MSSNLLKTYDEWKALGFHVLKGQKSTQRNSERVPLFSLTQVEKNKPRAMRYQDRPDYGEGVDYEEDRLMAEAYLGDRDWFV